jgi:DNA-binding protein HU-beta
MKLREVGPVDSGVILCSLGLPLRRRDAAVHTHQHISPRGKHMTLNELIDHVAGVTGVGKDGVKKVLDASLSTISEKAAKGEDVALAGFGQFKVKDTPARQGRNPATGATIEIAAARKLTFSAAKAVKDKLKV